MLLASGPMFTALALDPTQEITISITRDPETLDPAHLSWTSAHAVANNIFNGLVKWETGTFTIVPDLAYDWDISEDGLEYTFYLHEGVQFHGGYGEMTAHDVKFTFDRVMSPETASRWRSLIAMIDRVEVIDDYTVKFYNSTSSPIFLHNISAYRPGKILSRKAYEDLGEKYAFEPIGTGPFMFESWIPGEELVIVANDDYFEKAPILRKATYKVIPEDTVAAMAMEAGEIDTMLIYLGEIYHRWIDHPEIIVLELPSTGTNYVQIKTVMEPLNNVLVRKALAYATDTESIAQYVLEGIAEPMRTVIPEGMFGFCEEVPTYGYDPDKARELLAEAGYPQGFKTEVYNRDTERWRDVFTVIQSTWADIGVELTITPMDSTSWIEATTLGESPLAPLALGSRYDPDPILSGFFHGDVSSPTGRNFTWYGGADELINAAREELDPEKRMELYREIQLKFYEDVPTIPLFQPKNLRAVQPWVKGFVLGQVEDTYLLNVYMEGKR